MTRSFCTYFDKNYLSRGLALYDSLRAHHTDFTLYVGCMDTEARDYLARLGLPNMVVLGLDELEAHDPELRAVRPTRTLVEYYFTSTAAWLRYVFQRFPGVDPLTYVDADLCFFASSESAYAEMGDASIAIVAHRFPPALKDRENRGHFNVGWLSFRRDEQGLAAVDWWRARCIEWCYDRLEGDRFADQKYLDEWPRRYDRLVVLSHPGVNVAPWNLGGAPVRRVRGELTIDGRPLVCFHFHGLKHSLGPIYESGLRAYGVRLDPDLRRDVYEPYLEAVLRHEAALVRAGLSVGRARSLRGGQTRLMRAKERALKLVSVGRLLASGSYLVDRTS